MSRGWAKILHGVNTTLTAPLSPRQKAKTLARLGNHLLESGHKRITTKHGDLQLLAGLGAEIASAVQSFFSDEPETLYFIDEHIQPGELFWDIGANIGLYSLYAAQRGIEVDAFEPSGINFGILIRHIFMNTLDAHINPYCIALSDYNGLGRLNMNSADAGHASNALNESRDQHKDFAPAYSQGTISITGDDFASRYDRWPDHIKLDVDGIEPLILKGMPNVLNKAKSVLVEIEGRNAAHDQDILTMLEQAGLSEHPLSFEGGKQRNRLFVRERAAIEMGDE
ncbi:MAG: FkbM family methyltransferase [Alphaproteobacteria bacterium]|nr:FkbM family methyltransferase [Alphaproteobacteria bacterium]